MKRYWQSIISSPHFLPVLILILLTLFFRLYKAELLLPMGHDQDLLSWIVKDIVADKNLRLIGQETSISGVFISPAYYYLNAFFYSLFGMSQVGGVASYTLVSLATVLSIYYVFSKFFGKYVGRFGSFFYAVTIGVSFLDRWVVPTQPTILWCVWYLYVLLNILIGNFKIIPVLAILLGLILHVHIAFIPFLILLPLAFFLSGRKIRDLKKQITIKQLVISGLVFLFVVSPFILFELRHGFSQTQSLFSSVIDERGEARGLERIGEVFWKLTTSTLAMFNLQGKNNWLVTLLVPVILLLVPYYLKTKKLFNKEQLILIEVWVVFNLIIQTLSKRAISEYYFNNLFILVFLMAALLMQIVYKNFGKNFVFTILAFYLLANLYSLFSYTSSENGYIERKKTVEFIKQYSTIKGYPCIAINYIQKPGWATGFRYLFWKNGLNVITPGNDVAVFSIVVPAGYSPNELVRTFGMIGIILPNKPTIDPEACGKQDRQLLPPVGFV